MRTVALSITALPAIALIALTGCAPSPGDPALQTFESCGALRGHMARMARDEVSWAWGSNGIGIGRGTDFSLASAESDMGAPMDDGGGQAAGDYSGTNLQEQGVDEADLVKTDGKHLFALAGDHLVVTRAWPVRDAEQLAKVRIDGAPKGMYLVGDTVVVLSQIVGRVPAPRSGDAPSWSAERASVGITVIDVTERDAPVVLRETYTTGQLEQSRRIGNRLFLVTYEDVDATAGSGTKREARAALYEAEAEDWLARTFDSVADGEAWASTDAPACACEDAWAAEIESGTYLTTVQALDLSEPTGALRGSAIVGRSDLVYASRESLYLAHSSRSDGPFAWNGALDSVVHKFALDADVPTYLGSGRVNGVLPDQFGLSEHEGVLRVATTDPADWTSGVTTLEHGGDGYLHELGRIDGLAPGEALTAARFLGDVAYLVTYEVQLGDPLFTVDLSDPRNPTLRGELHLPGWSDYLHPMTDDRLLAVGMDQTPGGAWKLAVSLFDVSDLDDPTLTDRELLDASGSVAQTEHHAFTWHAPRETLSIPSWADDGQTVLEVLHATPDDVEPRGRVTQPRAFLSDAGDPSCAGVRRSVIMEDRVWAVSAAGMTAARIDDPDDRLQSLRFEGVDPCAERYWQGW